MGALAVVVGAGSGIGQGIAWRLASDGFELALLDVQPLTETIRGLPEPVLDVWSHQVDIREPAAVEAAFAALDGHGRGAPAVLVNVAGICPVAPFLETTVDDWDDAMDVNARGTFLCSQAAARRMRAAGGGRIVNILSTASVQGFATTSAYCASKGAALLLTRVMAVELAQYGIAVNGVAPGVVKTPLLGFYEENGEVERHDLQRTPLARWGTPADIAEAVSFLALGASWMTGQVIYVDGGFLACGLPLLPSLQAAP